MVQIQNKEILNTISEKIKESNLGILPNQLSDRIVPIIEVGKNIDEYISETAESTTTGLITAFTTPSSKDFYLVSCFMSFVKDVTCDLASSSLNVSATINGKTIRIIRMPPLTLTAERDFSSISLSTPIKLDRGTTVTLGGTFTAGNMVRSLGVHGFIKDTLQKWPN